MKTSRNIELKARCNDLSAAAQAAIELGAHRVGELVQTDTYFHSPRGRLKLREIEGQGAELIWYDRPNNSDFRASDYYVVAVSDAAKMKAALTASMGLLVEVRKRRELLMFENVRIHLDHVDGLGTFVEFEAVLEQAVDQRVSLERLASLKSALHIHDQHCIDVSYSDLIDPRPKE